MITLKQFEKVAFPLYDYTACRSRSYVPKSPELPKVKAENNSGAKVKAREDGTFVTPFMSKNKPSDAETTTYPYIITHTPTVSGTGGGPQLWNNPRDPYAK